MKPRTAMGIVASCMLLSGCTDASYQRQWSYGQRHKIVMYSGGKVIGEWISTGKPQSIADEDGWTFVDEATGELVIVTGDTVITKIK